MAKKRSNKPNLEDAVRRLSDAHRFWHQCADEYSDPNGFRVDLNACLESIRSSTYRLERQKRTSPVLNDWYKSASGAQNSDPIFKWVKASRDRTVHEADLALKSESRCHVILDYKDAARELNADLPFEDMIQGVDASSIRVFYPPIWYTVDEIIETLERSSIPKRVLATSFISLERRWEDSKLPGFELLEALAVGWGEQNRLLAEAHNQIGYSYNLSMHTSNDAIEASSNRYEGRLPCMISTRRYRTKSVTYPTQSSEIDLRMEHVVSTRNGMERARKRYGREPEFDRSSWASPIDILPAYMKQARRVVEVGEEHATMVFYFKGTDVVFYTVVFPGDRAAKRLLSQKIAEIVSMNEFDGIVMVGESWTGDEIILDSDGVPIWPEDMPNRRGALVVEAETADGRTRTLVQHFTRTTRQNVEFGHLEDHADGQVVSNIFLPTRRVWKSWRQPETGPVDDTQ